MLRIDSHTAVNGELLWRGKQQWTGKLDFNLFSKSFLERPNHASYLLSRAIHLASVCKLMCVPVHETINRINKRDSSSCGEEFEYGKQLHPILHAGKVRSTRIYVRVQYGKVWSIQKRRLIQTHKKTVQLYKVEWSLESAMN
jgi:hypothetical protein